MIIIVVIVLTLLASVFSRRVTELQMMAEKETDRERILLSVEIASYLFEKQKVTNVTMNMTLARALDKLLNATKSVESITKSLEKISKSKGLN
jgi:Na+-transporting NADH:ubiquinone oxidoreductase subunit NqrC